MHCAGASAEGECVSMCGSEHFDEAACDGPFSMSLGQCSVTNRPNDHREVGPAQERNKHPKEKKTYLRLLQRPLLQNLLNHLVIHRRAKLALEDPLGGAVVGSLGTLPIHTETCQHLAPQQRKEEQNIPVRHKHLERRHHLRQRHRLVAEPLLVVGRAVEEDEEVVVGALVVDLGLGGFSADHVCGFCFRVVVEGCRERGGDCRQVVFAADVVVVVGWEMDGYSLREGERDGVRERVEIGNGEEMVYVRPT